MSWLSKLWNSGPPPPPGVPCEPLASMLTDVGCQRERNEDSARIVRAGERGLLVVVADGMGGHEAGEVASQTAVEVIEKGYRESRATPGEALKQSFRRAHEEIRRLAHHNPSLAGMGTTCTALAISAWRAWAVHVGDSRLYLLRGNSIYQLSEDHTQCMEMVRRGLMSFEAARRHTDRNVLVRAMGTRRELRPMSWSEPMLVRPGDSFLLCSDGLHELVTAEEMREVGRGADPHVACRKLVEMARQRGGFDNITVAIAAVPPADRVAVTVKETRQFEVGT